VNAVDAREVVLSYLFEGAQTSAGALVPLMQQVERLLPLTHAQRQHTLIRADAGFGTDSNVNWLLAADYQVLVKGYSGKRAAAQARQVREWVEVKANDTWMARSPRPLAFARPTQTLVVRQRTPKGERHALYITTLSELSLAEVAALYDDRGHMEVEIQSDKMGLLVARRRKSHFAAQEMLILLNDWVHNLLALLHRALFHASPFAAFGPKRIVRDLFTIPGEAIIVNDTLIEVHLSQAHPYAAAMVRCLERLWQLPLA